MILLDANLLVYAAKPSLAQYRPAKQWLDEQLNGPTRIGLPWQALLAFLKVVINPRLFLPPDSVVDAWSRIESWLELPNVRSR